MITLPDFAKAFDYENNFYLSCEASRIRKILAQYELYKMSRGVPGAIVEFGILKGCSFARFAAFRQLFCDSSKKLVGFDSFGQFPETNFEPDKKLREAHIEAAGAESISRTQLLEVLTHKSVQQNVELIEGDITRTLPAYLEANPSLAVSLVNVDVDIYEPSKMIFELIYPRVVPGGIMILDDYGTFPGETKAANDYFAGRDVRIERLDFAESPCYVRKK